VCFLFVVAAQRNTQRTPDQSNKYKSSPEKRDGRKKVAKKNNNDNSEQQQGIERVKASGLKEDAWGPIEQAKGCGQVKSGARHRFFCS